jgi:hypothetical protein
MIKIGLKESFKTMAQNKQENRFQLWKTTCPPYFCEHFNEAHRRYLSEHASTKKHAITELEEYRRFLLGSFTLLLSLGGPFLIMKSKTPNRTVASASVLMFTAVAYVPLIHMHVEKKKKSQNHSHDAGNHRRI